VEITLTLDRELDAPLLTEHTPVEFTCDAPPDAQLRLAIGGQALEPFLRPHEAIWRWRWNPGAAVGIHRATLTAIWPDASTTARTWALRVATRKVDQDRYEALLDDIQRVAYGILYRLAGASAEGAGLQPDPPWRRSPLEDYYALFEERLDTFERAALRIAARPREHLRDIQERTPLGQASALGADALAWLPRGDFDEAPAGIADDLQAALRPGGGLLPREVPADRTTPTTDIYEHRLLKHLLTLLQRRARFIGALAEREAARLAAIEGSLATSSTRYIRAAQIGAGCIAATRRLRDLYALPLLADVRPLASFRGATPLLRRDAAYREVYRMWLALRQSPYVAFDSPLFHLPIADLPRLYEIWCALEVVRALLALGGAVREQKLVKWPDAAPADDLEFALDLVEQVPLLVIEHGERVLTLRYQPHYRPLGARSGARLGSLDRHTRVPDLAIEVQRPDTTPQVLLLDAKYRLDAEGRGVPQDALADAYAYLGALGYAGERATLGALLLYPGAGDQELYRSGVGTLPFLPGRATNLEAVLAARLDLL
jgi:hypothetical protein